MTRDEILYESMEHMFCEGEKSSKERLALLLYKVTKSKKKTGEYTDRNEGFKHWTDINN